MSNKENKHNIKHTYKITFDGFTWLEVSRETYETYRKHLKTTKNK